MTNIATPAVPRNVDVPGDLKAHRQFVVWKRVTKQGDAKPGKVPFNPTAGHPASTTDPSTWTDYATAASALAAGGYDGIGFVFTSDDPFVFIDLDDCRTSDGWVPHAITACRDMLPGAAWETSQSGNGLHGIARVSDKAALLDKPNKWTDAAGNRHEFYATGRFVAFGHCDWTRADLSEDCQARVRLFVPNRPDTAPVSGTDWHDTPRPDYGGPTDNDELIKRALAGFGRTPPFADLWNGNADALGSFFPHSNRPFDNSSAELALANALAWWTGCNPVRIERLMMMAPLCQRDKWQSRPQYRRDTIGKAIADPTRSYMRTKDRREQQQQVAMQIGEDLTTPPLPTIMTLDDMRRDLIHIGHGAQIIHRPSKTVRSREDAASEYAASVTEIDTGKVDRDGNPVMKKHRTLELWRQHPSRTSVDVVTWQPGEPEICIALEATGAGQRAYNLWTPPALLTPPANWAEWAKPFIDHVAYLVPIETERQRFMQWLAHIMQRPGELPHTCYLMIATTTGIGRGTLASMLARTFRGLVAVNADVGILLDKGFNGRLSQKLLATVDEIREGGNARYQQQENFKSAVVEETRHINPKFGRQHVEKNCCRWLLFSNHLDAVPFDNSDRRVIVIENPATPALPEWFEHLHRIIDDRNFIASIQHYLATLDISDFKPGERAPMSEAKAKAIRAMEQPADAAARNFKQAWPGDLATVADIRDYMGTDAPAHSKAMRHVIERAGMIMADKQRKIAGRLQTIVIVKGHLDRATVESLQNDQIVKLIVVAQTTFRAAP